jgi:hypothetical protein
MVERERRQRKGGWSIPAIISFRVFSAFNATLGVLSVCREVGFDLGSRDGGLRV